jgi:KTSC domain-containing protein
MDRFCSIPILDSEALSSVHYDALRERLRATFRESGRTYDYFGISAPITRR